MKARLTRRIVSLALLPALSGCVSYQPVSIETPMRPMVDVPPFQRVLVPSFIAGGAGEIDVDLETVRFLRSEFRSKASMAVIDAAPWSLNELAAETTLESAGLHEGAVGRRQMVEPKPTAYVENNIDASAELFANAAFWKRLGEDPPSTRSSARFGRDASESGHRHRHATCPSRGRALLLGDSWGARRSSGITRRFGGIRW